MQITDLKIGERYDIPSGMGGYFTVRLLAVHKHLDEVQVRVDMPLNPDWHGWLCTAKPDLLQPIRK